MEKILSQTVTGLFNSYDAAKQAVEALEAAGVHHHDISIVGSNAKGEHSDLPHHDHMAHGASEDAGKGAEVGGALGAAGGLLAGLGLLAIPGLGPVVAAGWLVSTLVGAVGHVFAEGVRRGGVLVTAKVDDDLAPEARELLRGDEAIDPELRREAYRQEGWTGFKADAPAYTSEQAEAERTRYSAI
jgi:hypothetical protein